MNQDDLNLAAEIVNSHIYELRFGWDHSDIKQAEATKHVNAEKLIVAVAAALTAARDEAWDKAKAEKEAMNQDDQKVAEKIVNSCKFGYAGNELDPNYVENPDVIEASYKWLVERFAAALTTAKEEQREVDAKKLEQRVIELGNYETRSYRITRRELEVAAASIRAKGNGVKDG